MTDAAIVARPLPPVHQGATTTDRVAISHHSSSSNSVAISRHVKANAAPVIVVPISPVEMHRRGRTLRAETNRRVDEMTDRPRRLRRFLGSEKGFLTLPLQSDRSQCP
jgi:hypothetical protein